MDLLIEIGTEELPASSVYSAVAQVEEALPALLERARLGAGGIRVLGTPRRIAAVVTRVPEEAGGRTLKKRGPALQAAREEDGSWSRAAEGFARSQGIETDDLAIEETGKGSYVFAVTEVPGLPAGDLLPDLLSELVGLLSFPRSMRWGSSDERFARPVRWLLGVADGRVVPFRFGKLIASNITFGHRYLASGPVTVNGPAEYEAALEGVYVMVDHERRRERILESAREVCAAAGMVPFPDGDVLDEVVQLVEWPGVVLGRFDDGHLRLPREVLVHAMQEHQRYFPVTGEDGRIQPAFVAVHNGDPVHADVIARGHMRVLAARLADAGFFYDEDLKRPLADRTADLEHVVYQSELGSMAEKSERLEALVRRIGEGLGLAHDAILRACRAGRLAKCDLVTHMVVEFPALQGVVGSIYAGESGEDERVARAIYEQYLPRRTGDSLPGTDEGTLLALAEKADNLAASFGLGHIPSGSEDPYALRRQALGILLITIERGLLLSITEMVQASAAALEAEAHGFAWTTDAESALEEFFLARERAFFLDRGYRYDIVEAVLAVDWDRPLSALRRLGALDRARESGLLARLYTAFERCRNLSRSQPEKEISVELMLEPAEEEVFSALADARGRVEAALPALDFDAALAGLEPLCAPVDRLFDEVLIMAEEEAVRANRLSLLAGVASLFESVAGFSRLVWD